MQTFYYPAPYARYMPVGLAAAYRVPPSAPYVSAFIFGGKYFPNATNLTFVEYYPHITVYEVLTRAGVNYGNDAIASVAGIYVGGSVQFRLLRNGEAIDSTMLSLQVSPYDLLQIDLINVPS